MKHTTILKCCICGKFVGKNAYIERIYGMFSPDGDVVKCKAHVK